LGSGEDGAASAGEAVSTLHVLLDNGMEMVVTDEINVRYLINAINDGGIINCRTTETYDSDRKIWRVSAGHIVAFREYK
jgi:hypothetical protein